MYERILVPTDGSDAATAAVDEALSLARVHGAMVHTLYVVEPVYSADYGTEQILESLRSQGERATAAVADRGEREDVTVVTAVREGPPHQVIREYATDEDVDLIVMGTHGRRGLERYLLGSVTEHVVRLSDVPVLTVRGDEEDG